jgi:hypothetical protein
MGRSFPLFSARRRIPAQAFPLKKYFGGMGLASRICDNEHTLAALGQAEVLGIQDSPRCSPIGSIDHARVRESLLKNDGLITADKRCQEAAKGVVAR